MAGDRASPCCVSCDTGSADGSGLREGGDSLVLQGTHARARLSQCKGQGVSIRLGSVGPPGRGAGRAQLAVPITPCLA